MKNESKTVEDAYNAYYKAMANAVESQKVAKAAWEAVQTAWEEVKKADPSIRLRSDRATVDAAAALDYEAYEAAVAKGVNYWESYQRIVKSEEA